jgi:hypothetical protein
MAHLLAQCNKNTPSAWMTLINIPNCVLNSVQNCVLNGDYFNRAQVDYFSLAPRLLKADLNNISRFTVLSWDFGGQGAKKNGAGNPH